MYFGILVIIIGIAMLGATSKPDNTVILFPTSSFILVQPNAIIINVILILGSILPVIMLYLRLNIVMRIFSVA